MRLSLLCCCFIIVSGCLRKHPGSAPHRTSSETCIETNNKSGECKQYADLVGRSDTFFLKDITVGTSCNHSEYKLCVPNDQTTIECQVTGCGGKTHVIARITPNGKDELDEAKLCPDDSTKLVADSNIVLRCLFNYAGTYSVGTDLKFDEKTLAINPKTIMSGEICVTISSESLAKDGKGIPLKYTTTPEVKTCNKDNEIDLLQLKFKI